VTFFNLIKCISVKRILRCCKL